MDTNSIIDILGEADDSLPKATPEPLSDEDIEHIFNN